MLVCHAYKGVGRKHIDAYTYVLFTRQNCLGVSLSKPACLSPANHLWRSADCVQDAGCMSWSRARVLYLVFLAEELHTADRSMAERPQ